MHVTLEFPPFNTSCRRRREYELPVDENFDHISNDELDTLVARVLQDTPQAGLNLVLGATRARGLRLQRDSMIRVDQITSTLRNSRRVVRRTYRVPRDHQGEGVNSPYRLCPTRVIHLNLFLDMVLSSSANFTRAIFPRCAFSWRKQRRRVMADRASSKRKFEVSNTPSNKRKKTSPNLFCGKERTCTLCDRNKIENLLLLDCTRSYAAIRSVLF